MSSGDLSLREKAGTRLVEMSSLQAGVMLPAMTSTLTSQRQTLQRVSLDRSSADKLRADLVTKCDQTCSSLTVPPRSRASPLADSAAAQNTARRKGNQQHLPRHPAALSGRRQERAPRVRQELQASLLEDPPNRPLWQAAGPSTSPPAVSRAAVLNTCYFCCFSCQPP